jgi:hypothetical protein
MVDQIFYGEVHLYRMSLSDVRVIIVIMRVLIMELLCQTMTGQILALECLLPGMRGHMRLCPVLSRLLGHLPRTDNPQTWLLRVWTCAELGHKEELDQADRWQNLARPRLLRGDKRTDTDHARV